MFSGTARASRACAFLHVVGGVLRQNARALPHSRVLTSAGGVPRPRVGRRSTALTRDELRALRRSLDLGSVSRARGGSRLPRESYATPGRLGRGSLALRRAARIGSLPFVLA